MPLVPHVPAAESEAHASQIVALDAGDLAGADLQRAEALLALCAGCVALHDDLGAIRKAMPSLPAPARRRDFRLTEADAARLRPSGWRRVTGWLAAPGSTVRPLATGLATLGVVGLLLTAGLPGMGGGVALFSTGGAADGAAEGVRSTYENAERFDVLQTLVPEAASPLPAEAPVPGLAGEASPAAGQQREEAPAAQPNAGGSKAGDDALAAEPGPSAPVVVSLVLLVTGLGLLLARAIALRRA